VPAAEEVAELGERLAVDAVARVRATDPARHEDALAVELGDRLVVRAPLSGDAPLGEDPQDLGVACDRIERAGPREHAGDPLAGGVRDSDHAVVEIRSGDQVDAVAALEVASQIGHAAERVALVPELLDHVGPIGCGEQVRSRRGVGLAGLRHACANQALAVLVVGHVTLVLTARTSAPQQHTLAGPKRRERLRLDRPRVCPPLPLREPVLRIGCRGSARARCRSDVRESDSGPSRSLTVTAVPSASLTRRQRRRSPRG
jgi:hypothetical protein